MKILPERKGCTLINKNSPTMLSDNAPMKPAVIVIEKDLVDTGYSVLQYSMCITQ